MGKFNFEHGLDQMVVTPFGDNGLITMLGFDEGGRKYYVQTATNSDWFKESQLSPALVKEDMVEDFLSDMCLTSDSQSESTPFGKLYRLYKIYCDENGGEQLSGKGFLISLSSLGYKVVRKPGGLRVVGVTVCGGDSIRLIGKSILSRDLG